MNAYVKNRKRKFIIAGITFSLIIVTFICLLFIILPHQSINKSVSIQQAGEMLTVRYTTTYAREHSTDVYIFSKKQSGELTHYLVDGDYIPPKIKQIYNTQNLVAYEWSAGKIYFITYKEKRSVLQSFSSIQIDDGDFQNANLLYPVAKQQFDTKRWECINLFGELLLKCNDTDVKATLQRYARGLFTDQETLINQHSAISSTDVQQNAAKLLSQY